MNDRHTIVAAAIAIPAIVTTLCLGAIEVYRAIDPASPLFGDPPATSLAQAITRGMGVEQAYTFIRAGQDPNALITIDDEDYTGGAAMQVSPLVAAVASRDTNIVQMLLNFGARPDLPQNRLAWCLARALSDDSSAALIAGAPRFEAPACPAARPAPKTPPLAYLSSDR